MFDEEGKLARVCKWCVGGGGGRLVTAATCLSRSSLSGKEKPGFPYVPAKLSHSLQLARGSTDGGSGDA